MSLKEIWKDKVDGVDDVLAEDINAIARQAILNEESIESVSNRVDGLNDDMTANTASINRRIDNLEGMLIKYTEDSSEVYAKSVPTNSAHKAILNRVGGKTIKKGSKNICTDAVEGGIPFTAPLGNSYILDIPLLAGTYSYYVNVDIESEHLPGQKRLWDGDMTLSNPFTLEESRTVYYEIENFESYNTGDVTGKLYLNIVEGTQIPTEYEPYEAPSLEPTKVTEIVSVGKNRLPSDVFNLSAWEKYADSWWRYNLDLADGWYCITAKLKEGYKGDVFLYFTKKGADGKYTSANAVYYGDGKNSHGYLIIDSGVTTAPYWFKVDNKADSVYRLAFSNATQAKLDEIEYIQIERVKNLEKTPSSAYMPMAYAPPTEYEPYRRISYPIPTEIQNKEGYGCGVGDVCNYIDYARKVYVQNVKVIDLGSLDWTATHSAKEGYRRYIAEFSQVKPPINDTAIANILCSKYNTITSTDVYLANEGIAISASGKVCIFDSILSSDTLSNFKEAIQGVMMCYELTEPIETDISDDILTDYPDYKFIEVEGKGEIIAENENKNPVPWTVTFAEV